MTNVTNPIDFDALTTIIDAGLAGVARTKLRPKLVNLKDRETEILTWVARGQTSAQIACKLHMAKRTVDFHIDNAFNRFEDFRHIATRHDKLAAQVAVMGTTA